MLRLTRLRGDDDAPFVYFESYFHPRIGLTGDENFSRPLYEILETDFHVIPSISKEKIKVIVKITHTEKLIQIEINKNDKCQCRHLIIIKSIHITIFQR